MNLDKKKITVWLILICCFICIQGTGQVKVYWRSDGSKILERGSVVQLTGNVAFYHNGAVITCDTAYRYGEQRMEGLGRVIINTDSTFIYGDRFTYDSETNIARVYAPLIKTIDKDAVLYTHNMQFNTLTNIGSYFGGGTLSQKDNLMESERGDYYTGTRTIVLVGDVSMKNDDYEIKTDSIGFNLNTEFVTFYDQADIWNSKGEFLQANKGTYDRELERYDFFDEAYVLTKEQEVWADSMQYNSKTAEALLWKNIQILDTVQMAISFGDFGRYWGNYKRAVLTENPSVITYDINQPDSSFIRADTLFLAPALDFVHHQKTPPIDSLLHAPVSLIDSTDLSPALDSSAIPLTAIDSTIIDSSSVSKEELPNKKEKFKKERERKKIKKEKSRKRNKSKKIRFREKMLLRDTLQKNLQAIDSLATDSLSVDSSAINLPVQNDIPLYKTEPDSSDYIIRGFHKVRIFRDSVQSVCDSLVLISMDSTMRMYDNPIIWSDNSQITADSIIMFTRNQQLFRAELYNFPIMIQQLKQDTARYNQIRGKFMEAFFKKNALDVIYIDQNAETRFYKETDNNIDGLFAALSGSMKITFADSQIDQIYWYQDIATDLYPIDKIPPTLELFLKGFAWHEPERPKSRAEVFDRPIRNSFRAQAILIAPPTFPITTTIDREKAELLKAGTWEDRNEPLPLDKNTLVIDY